MTPVSVPRTAAIRVGGVGGMVGRRARDTSALLGVVVGGLLTSCSPLRAQTSAPVIRSADVHGDRPGSGNVVQETRETSRARTTGEPRLITLEVTNVPLGTVLDQIAQQAKISILYSREQIPVTRLISYQGRAVSVDAVLAAILRDVPVDARRFSNGDIRLVRVAKPQQAQQASGTIMGRVMDSATRKTIVGATVSVVGTKMSGTTNNVGVFRLVGVLPGQYSLSIRMLGYGSQVVSATVEADKTTSVDVVLRQTSTTLSEVVTTATGQQRRVEVANDIVKIDADSLMRTSPVRSVTDMLAAARIPGVDVTPSSGIPGAPSRIRLRGVGSISQSNDPVVVVDGVWINAATSTEQVRKQVQSSNSRNLVNNEFVSSPLDNIDPNSIETIEVLRGPSAASLYGTDAANGVIVITTKRGQTGKTRWTLNAAHSWNESPGQYQAEYTASGIGLLNSDVEPCSIQQVFDLFCRQTAVSGVNPLNTPLLTNEVPGRDVTYSGSVGGGTPTLQYNVTTSYRNSLGATKLPTVDRVRLRQLGESVPRWIRRPDGFSQWNFSTQLNVQPSAALDLNILISGVQSEQYNNGATFIRGSAIRATDTLAYATDGIDYLRERLTSTRSGGVIGASAHWRPWSWISSTMRAGLDRNHRSDDGIATTRLCYENGCDIPDAKVASFGGVQSVYSADVLFSVPLSFGRWERFLSLRPDAGASLRRNLSSGLRVTGDSLLPGSEDLGTAAKRTVTPVLNNNSATAGAWLDLRVGVWQRFYTTLGFRRDIGSALSTQIHAPTYPKLGTSWLISEEPFFPRTDLVNRLRLRIAYGHSAVQPDIGAVNGVYQYTQTTVNGATVNALVTQGLGNYKLRPERAVEAEYGFDADLLEDRAHVSFTVGTRTNRDELVSTRLAPSAASAEQFTYTRNIARVFNRSVELSASGDVIKQPGFLWSLSMTMSTLTNRVERLGDDLALNRSVSTRIVEGYPIHGLWARPVLSYNDVNKDGVLQPNEVVIGDTVAYVGWPQPRYSLNYASSLQLFGGRVTMTGNVAYEGQRSQFQQVYDGRGFYDFDAPLSEQARARVAVVREGTVTVNYGNRQTFSSLRFQSASATMLLPDSWARALRATAGSLSVRGSNLGLWTNYRGRDPGVNSSPIGEELSDDGRTLPQPRKYDLSIRLNF